MCDEIQFFLMSDYIPESILVLILKSLSVKSLYRFRSVCKWWKRLIDSPSLVQEHLADQKPQFLLQSMEPELMVLDPRTLSLIYTLSSLNEDVDLSSFLLIGTLHGIICLYDNDNDIYLWNPWIRKFSNIPLPDDMQFRWYEYKNGAYSAFWIDPSTKEYKIIVFKLMFYDNDVDEYWALYWSIEGEWIKLPLGKLWKCRPLEESPAIVIGEMAYWRAFYDFEYEEGESGMNVVVISFDFELQRFNLIEAPSVKYEDSYHPILCNWQGSLSLVYMDPEWRCDIYLRQHGSWVNVSGFNLPCLISRVLCVLGDVDESGRLVVEEDVHENSKILATTAREELVLYDNRSGFVSLKSGLEDSDVFYVAQGFVESLLFP